MKKEISICLNLLSDESTTIIYRKKKEPKTIIISKDSVVELYWWFTNDIKEKYYKKNKKVKYILEIIYKHEEDSNLIFEDFKPIEAVLKTLTYVHYK